MAVLNSSQVNTLISNGPEHMFTVVAIIIMIAIIVFICWALYQAIG